MDDLISREAALDAIFGCFNVMESKGIDMTVSRTIVKGVLDEAPAVSAIPMKWMEQRRFETSFHGAEPDIDLNYAFGTVMNEWQKEQEAKTCG